MGVARADFRLETEGVRWPHTLRRIPNQYGPVASQGVHTAARAVIPRKNQIRAPSILNKISCAFGRRQTRQVLQRKNDLEIKFAPLASGKFGAEIRNPSLPCIRLYIRKVQQLCHR